MSRLDYLAVGVMLGLILGVALTRIAETVIMHGWPT